MKRKINKIKKAKFFTLISRPQLKKSTRSRNVAETITKHVSQTEKLVPNHCVLSSESKKAVDENSRVQK